MATRFEAPERAPAVQQVRRSFRWFAAIYVGLLLMLIVLAAAPAPANDASECRLSPEETHWLQDAMKLWDVSLKLLEQENERLPWMILFDQTCTFHINPEPGKLPGLRPVEAKLNFRGTAVPISAVAHYGKIDLPDGTHIAPRIMGMTGLYAKQSKTFFVTALPDIWRAQPEARDVDPERFPLGVVAHEMVHTLDLVGIERQIEALRKRSAQVPKNLTDDTIEQVFGKQMPYREAYRAERDLLRSAVNERDDQQSRKLLAQALDAIANRRNRFFRDELAFYGDLDELFLLMEGTAVWTHAKLAARFPALVEFHASGNTAWSQEEGYLLFQLIDRFVPGWQRRVLATHPAMPTHLLREVAARTD